MHIVTIDNFLVCCSLEAGGYVVGYLGAISSFIGVISFIGLLTLLSVSYEEVKNSLAIDFSEDFELIQSILKESQISEINKISVKLSKFIMKNSSHSRNPRRRDSLSSFLLLCIRQLDNRNQKSKNEEKKLL